MSFNGAALILRWASEEGMAKWEIHRRFGFIAAMWWRFMPGEEITIKWPAGKVIIDDSMPQYDLTMGAARYEIESADPNDHYRPALEQNVGRQGWDWNWRIGPMAAINDTGTTVGFDTLTIKFRRGKEKWASYYKLKWA